MNAAMWQINLTVIDRKARKAKKKSIIYRAVSNVPTEAVTQVIHACLSEAQKAIDYQATHPKPKPHSQVGED